MSVNYREKNLTPWLGGAVEPWDPVHPLAVLPCQTWSLEVKHRESTRVPKIWESSRRRGAQNIIWSSLYFISLLLSFTCLFTVISLNYYGNKNWDVRTENLKNMVAFAHSRAAEDYKHRSVNDCQRARQRFSQRKTTTLWYPMPCVTQRKTWHGSCTTTGRAPAMSVSADIIDWCLAETCFWITFISRCLSLSEKCGSPNSESA